MSFFGGLGALQVPLGSFLGLPKALLGGLWTSKTLKNLRFFKVFWKDTFSLLWNSWWHFGGRLGGPWADLGTKMDPKRKPKVAPKWSENCSKFDPQKGPKTTPKWGPKIC